MAQHKVMEVLACSKCVEELCLYLDMQRPSMIMDKGYIKDNRPIAYSSFFAMTMISPSPYKEDFEVRILK